MVIIVETVPKYADPRILSLRNCIIPHNKRTSHLDTRKQKPIQGIIIPLGTHTNIRKVGKMMMKTVIPYQILKKVQSLVIKVLYQGNIVIPSE